MRGGDADLGRVSHHGLHAGGDVVDDRRDAALVDHGSSNNRFDLCTEGSSTVRTVAASQTRTHTFAGLAADTLYWVRLQSSSHGFSAWKPVRTLPATVSVAVSSTAGADDTYAIGDTISLTATFSENVTVTTAPAAPTDDNPVVGPRIAFTLGTETRHAVYDSGSGSTELVFEYEVAEGDADTDGIEVAENALELNDGAIEDSGDGNASLTHAALAAQSAHKVDGVRPGFDSASVNGTALTVTFDEALGAAADLANSAFTVKKTPRDGTEETVSLSGTPSIADKVVTLTLASAVADTDTAVKVSYAVPDSGTDNKVVDAVGNTAAGFTDQAVTNDSPDTTGPTLASASVDGATLTLTFDEDLDTSGTAPAAGAFTVSGTAATTSVTAVAFDTNDAKLVVLTLSPAVAHGESGITVGYTEPTGAGANPLADAVGNKVATFSGEAVTNATPDTTKPTLASASVDGTTLTLTFDEDLDTSGTAPAAGAFTVSGTAAATSVTAVAFDGTDAKLVVLTLSPAVEYGDGRITVDYDKPTGAGANPLKDPSANEVETFDGEAVSNDTAFAGICGRTMAVRDALLTAVAKTDCAAVTLADLAGLTRTLNLSSKSITALKSGDFSGLTALKDLYLFSNSLSSLPSDLFDGLTALTSLELYDNSLSSLPAGVFDELTALTTLYLFRNSLSSLPSDLFDGLTALTSLELHDNSLSSLPAGVFDDLGALTTLHLGNNSLSNVPAGVFGGLTALTTMTLSGNPGAPFALTVGSGAHRRGAGRGQPGDAEGDDSRGRAAWPDGAAERDGRHGVGDGGDGAGRRAGERDVHGDAVDQRTGGAGEPRHIAVADRLRL